MKTDLFHPNIYTSATVGCNCCFLFTQPYRQKIRNKTARLIFISCWLYLAHPFPFDFFSLNIYYFPGLGTSLLWELFPRMRRSDLPKQGHTLVTTKLGVWPLESILFCLHYSPSINWTTLQIPWMEEPGRLQSMGWLGVGHDWATSLSLFTFMHRRRKWQPTPVFLPGESQGWGSLVGFHPWGRTESDMTEAT